LKLGCVSLYGRREREIEREAQTQRERGSEDDILIEREQRGIGVKQDLLGRQGKRNDII
jgi:hypothetical protein